VEGGSVEFPACESSENWEALGAVLPGDVFAGAGWPILFSQESSFFVDALPVAGLAALPVGVDTSSVFVGSAVAPVAPVDVEWVLSGVAT
jgi:hypothetical protein